MTEQFTFQPTSLSVPVGATVTWRNSSGATHSATDDPARAQDPTHAGLPAGAQPWDSGDIAPGQNGTRTFSTPGTYLYFCRFHEGRGMVASITVR
jgi:plastocyanin